MTSPEYYGAVGDGIADDTLAWQNAIDSGQPIKAESSKYLCGTLNVTRDAEIDCNNAEFIAKDTILFNCYGSVEKETVESSYTANQVNYRLSDNFTGIAHIYGVNNVFKSRSYYKGGSTESFSNGLLQARIPVDIETPTVYELNTITVKISNIANVTFVDSTNAVIIKMQYVRDSVVENVNMTNLCYSVVQFWQCYKCTYKNSTFDIPQYGDVSTNYYPVEILDTCYTKLLNLTGHCVGWHCATTGNHTLCRQTLVDNCTFSSDYAIPAYGDHENGIETTIKNSNLTSVGLGVLGSIENCTIKANVMYQMCRILLGCCSVDGLAVYSIRNCEFYPENESYSGICVYLSPQSSGYNYDYYFDKLTVENCTNKSKTISMNIKNLISGNVTGTVDIDTITVKDSSPLIQATAKTKSYAYTA